MVVFESISWQNFLSTGAGTITIDLIKHKSNLITGKNGAGKSTLLDAICFVLFNKPFRNVNKNQLINSINGKNTLVEITFSTSGKRYTVKRGIKPNVFEIYENDSLINKEAASKDYQKILEQQILKYNYKTFTQIVIIGSATFVPFMQLPTGIRREVIEDVLDIGVFSTMNILVKERLSVTKNAIMLTENEIDVLEQKIENQEKMIKFISTNKEEEIKSIDDQIESITEDNQIQSKRIDEYYAQVESLKPGLSEREEFVNAKDKSRTLITKYSTLNEDNNKKLKFFSTKDQCSVCSQPITQDHKTNIINQLSSDIESSNERIEVYTKALEKINSKLQNMEKINSEIFELNNKIRACNSAISSNNSMLEKLRNSRREKSESVNNINAEKDTLKKLMNDKLEKESKRVELLETKQLQEQALLLLKDTGIKTSIIREYLPIINKQINKYLSATDFYVNFEIDETFNEKIKSRFRDEFNYQSFSEGEKQRIDMAIMFTFRHIAKIKNSLNTNLLIIDEIFGSSLDATALSFFVSMLGSIENTNVWVITHHADQFKENFENHIKFEKRNDFSIMEIA